METSDSEGCFESADEDFDSDNESTIKKPTTEKLENIVGEINKLAIESTNVAEVDNNSNADVEVQHSNNNQPANLVRDDKAGGDVDVTTSDAKASDEESNTQKHIIREECWEPGVDYDVDASDVWNSNEGWEVKENAVEEVKQEECQAADVKKKELEETVTSRNKAERKINKEEVEVLTKTETTSPSHKVTEIETQLENKETLLTKSTDEDLWANDDNWSIEDAETSKNTQELSKETQKDTSKPDTQEEDLWGDDDNWESTDVKKSHDDDNLWSKDDNWGTNKSEPAKPTKDDDLWGDEDDWDLGDDARNSQAMGKEEAAKDQKSWGDWGNWGINSVLSTAANLTSTVSQGITNVLETSIGVPDPAQLAREHAQEKEAASCENMPKTDEQAVSSGFNLGNLVSGVSTITKLVESTSSKVISGGLDTLETIGKKTMEVLQENDPGLKKKRAFLKIDTNKPVLSQILREAKEKAELENKELEKKHIHKKANYETLFDDYQGLVHLEALEMLSKQCEIKLDMTLSKSDNVTEMQETMEQVKELCEISEDDDENNLSIDEIKENISTAINDINIPISYNKVIDVWVEISEWIGSVEVSTHKYDEVHEHAIENLAHLTAMVVEQYHKAGELLLVKEHRSTADEADSLVQLTISISASITLLSTKYSEKLNLLSSTSDNKEEISASITNIFLEASNSCRYIEDAFKLLIPVLQVGAI